MTPEASQASVPSVSAGSLESLPSSPAHIPIHPGPIAAGEQRLLSRGLCVCVCVYVFFVHVLVIVNSAAVNIGVHGVYVSFQIRVFSRHMLRSEIARSYNNSVF